MIAWVFGGYFAAVLLGMVAGNRSSSRALAGTRVAALAAFAVLGSLLTLLVVRLGFDVLGGSVPGAVGVRCADRLRHRGGAAAESRPRPAWPAPRS